MKGIEFFEQLKRLKAIADTGLLYSKNDYDRERYLELQEMSVRLLSELSGHAVEALKVSFPLLPHYPTAKVDIRGFVLSPENKVLLVKESMDGKWSLPGGWADIGYSPKETIIKEFKEETGLDVTVKALVAIFDKRLHAHPPQPFYVYKLVYYCVPNTLQINKGFDVLDVQYFDVDNLPELSEDRILKTQIDLVYQKVLAADFETHSD